VATEPRWPRVGDRYEWPGGWVQVAALRNLEVHYVQEEEGAVLRGQTTTGQWKAATIGALLLHRGDAPPLPAVA
jgi:hypothetical protein